jgi:hypothetical protein
MASASWRATDTATPIAVLDSASRGWLITDRIALAGPSMASTARPITTGTGTIEYRDHIAIKQRAHAQASAAMVPPISSASTWPRPACASRRFAVSASPPHSRRHTTAVHMRRAGDDPNVIAALLGHAQITTTERFYGHVDLEEKRKAIEANPPPVKPARGRWRRPEVLEFLESL